MPPCQPLTLMFLVNDIAVQLEIVLHSICIIAQFCKGESLAFLPRINMFIPEFNSIKNVSILGIQHYNNN